LRHVNVINDVDDNLTYDDNIVMKINYLAIWIISLCLSACSYTSPITRQFDADQLAVSKEWQREMLTTTPFELVSYMPAKITSNDVLTVYIEGDGFAWQNSRRPSSDPTPHNPVALKLALQDPNKSVAYLARPCQYQKGLEKSLFCDQVFWTNKRYAPEVIEASEQALTQLKNIYNAKELVLVGYSGGAAVAALLAAQRDDVIKLITVAGNLNHQAWTEFHNVSPLIGSLNPVDVQKQLQTISQIHFVGKDDKNIPPKLVHDFIASYDSDELANLIVVPGQSHNCCWQDIWPSLISNTKN